MAALRRLSVHAVVLAVIALVALGCTTASPSPSPAPTAAPTAAPSPTGIVPPPTPTPPQAFPITVTDDEGTALTIEARPDRVVTLTPDATETMFAIGAGDRVVGKVQDISNFPPEAASVPEVATFAGVDVEKIVALEPDLVISGGAGLTQGPAVEQLRKAGIDVLVSYPTTIDGGLASISRIGQAVGLAATADHLADTLRNRLDDLAAAAATAPDRPRVFYEIDVTGGIFTPPADSIYGEMIRLAGAEPISGNASYSISLEQLVAADPEVILLGDGAYGVTREAVEARDGWGGMAAVRDGRIVAVDDVIITRPGPRLADGLRALIDAIHPGLIPDVLLPSIPPGPLGTGEPGSS